MIGRRLIAAGGSGGSFTPPEEEPPPEGVTAITILGDSVSAAWGVTEAQRYGVLLGTALGVTVNIQATPGAQSLYLANPANYTLGTPDLVIIECGLNDMGWSISKASFKANIEDIIADVRGALDPDPAFVIVVCYDIPGTYALPWSDYCDAMLEVAAADGEVTALDLRPSFGSPSTTYLQGDLVHPNPTGHELIADLLHALLT